MARTVWNELPNGFEAQLAEGALTLLVFYDNGWRSCINDRVMKYPYSSADEAKRATISWARGKLEMITNELRDLERNTTEAV